MKDEYIKRYFEGLYEIDRDRFDGIEVVPLDEIGFDMEVLGFNGRVYEISTQLRSDFERIFRDVMESPGKTDRILVFYERVFGLARNQFERFCSEAERKLGRKIKVLDAGSGKGEALKEILALPSVDEKLSVGLTLPIGLCDDPLVRERTLFANIIHLTVKEKGRFDVICCMMGVDLYYPLELRDSEHEEFVSDGLESQARVNPAGILHLLNMLNIGGYVFSSQLNLNIKNGPYDYLIQKGVLACPSGAHAFGSDAVAAPCVLELVRRPNQNEIAALLELNLVL